MRETGLEPASTYVHMNLNHARLPIPPFPQIGGQGWIRTTEANSGRFTVCSLWPLGNLPVFSSPLDPKGGAGDGTRTRNLLITNQLLCQLSYASTKLFPTQPADPNLKSGDPEGARTLDLQRDRLAL